MGGPAAWIQGIAVAGILWSGWKTIALDARLCRISWWGCGGMTAFGLLWWLSAAPALAGLGNAGAGLLLGALGGFLPILVAHWRGRRWPMMSGDIILMAALGAVTGFWAFPLAMLAGALASLLHRFCLQRKRGRPFARGYLPLAPGLVTGALAVFGLQVAGVLPLLGAALPL